MRIAADFAETVRTRAAITPSRRTTFHKLGGPSDAAAVLRSMVHSRGPSHPLADPHVHAYRCPERCVRAPVVARRPRAPDARERRRRLFADAAAGHGVADRSPAQDDR